MSPVRARLPAPSNHPLPTGRESEQPMSIFRRDTDEPRPAAAGTANLHASPAPAPGGSERRPNQPSSPAATTHIAPGAKITGEVNGTSDLVVDGELEGQVRLESNVTIGAEGRVQGD